MTTPRIKAALVNLLKSGEKVDKHIGAEKVYASTRVIRRYLTQLHKAGGIHISQWKHKNQGPPLAVYSYGPGKDAVYPTPPTPAERKRKQRKNPLYTEKYNFLKRAKRSLGRNVRIGVWGL